MCCKSDPPTTTAAHPANAAALEVVKADLAAAAAPLLARGQNGEFAVRVTVNDGMIVTVRPSTEGFRRVRAQGGP